MARGGSSRSGDVLQEAAPRFAAADAEALAAEIFGVCGDAGPLDSERDQNFALRVAGGDAYVLKISNPAESPDVIDFHTRALHHIAERDPDLAVPRVQQTLAGETCSWIEGPDGRRHALRLLSFLPGTLLGQVPREPALLRDLGRTLARLGRALRGFFHPAAGWELLWDLKHAARLREHVVHIRDPERARLTDGALARFEAHALPRLPGLRAQVIHNDVSLHNTLVDPAGARVSGVFDFGDMVHAPLVNDLAVTVSEVVRYADDPVAASAYVVAGYASITTLEEDEVALLPDLVAARLAMELAISAWRTKEHPENREYIEGSVEACSTALERLTAFDAGGVGERLRSAASTAGVETLLERRARSLGPTLSLFYERPLHLVRGSGTQLFDASGRAYLDAYNNVPHVGHCHPAVVDALARQAATLNTNTRYLYESVLDYAERLAATLPAGLELCMFVCSGSEANDLAWRLAKAHTGHGGAIVVEGAYHGTTDAVADLSPAELPKGAPLAPHVRAVPPPDDYRGPHRRGEANVGERYAATLDVAIESLASQGQAPAAFLLDTMMASSGIFPPPPDYLAGAFSRVRAAGGLCIADEVQAGFGRTGDHMWGFGASGVVPDIVTLGKPIGNGHPLAVVVTTTEIAASLAEQGEFFSTFGGNPVSCAAGLAVLDVLEREGLRENARRVGTYLLERLVSLARERPWIGDVRGAGLFVGVELVRDRETLEPADGEAEQVVNGMRDEGVLIGRDGLFGNVLKIRPPLVFRESDADRLVQALDRTLATL